MNIIFIYNNTFILKDTEGEKNPTNLSLVLHAVTLHVDRIRALKTTFKEKEKSLPKCVC